MTPQPIKRVLCHGKPHPQCAKCARQTEKPDAFKAPEFINEKCPMRVQNVGAKAQAPVLRRLSPLSD